MVRIVVFLMVIFLSAVSFGQSRGLSYGVAGSFDLLNPINSGAYIPGISVAVELPRNESVVPYGKFGYFLPHREEEPGGVSIVALDPLTTNPIVSTARLDSRINTFSLEGGTRYYLGNDYDIGLAAMLETKIRLLISPVKSILGDFDETKYELAEELPSQNYTSVTAYVGFAGGIKYSQPWGTVYAMSGLDLLIFGNVGTPITSSMLFSVQVGFRRDFY
jgi:hypothetical protein